MAKKTAAKKSAVPKFADLTRDKPRGVQRTAKALRDLVFQVFPKAEENFMGGKNGMVLYRTLAEVCAILPCDECCTFYLTRGSDLDDPDGLLHGTAKSARQVKISTVIEIENLPLRQWLRQSLKINKSLVGSGPSFAQALKKLRKICFALPEATETMTWGKPHFRVRDKIFCGCGEEDARPEIGLKAEQADASLLVKLPGLKPAPYGGKHGWVSIDPSIFDDWNEIARLVTDSYRLIAPKRLVAEID